MTVEIIRDVSGIRQKIHELKSNGKTVALVPTMGGLHEGHLSLIRKAKEIADHVVVSIFINPKQFNNPADLKSYPGNEEEDLQNIDKSGAGFVFMPGIEEMYPDGFSTNVTVSAATNILCDVHRPGHFNGVSTVVTKLFIQVGANFACFGEKDYQQLFIVKSLVRDLNIPIKIIPVPTIREEDGLAMSSRNMRLTPEERKTAPQLYASMQQAKKLITVGENIKPTCKQVRQDLEAGGNFKVEYLEVRCGHKMTLMENLGSDCRLFAAAWLGDVRLIDNIEL